MCHHAMLYDKGRKWIGWTYAYGDYWGPFTAEEAVVGLDLPWHGPTFMVRNFYVTQELA